MADPILANELIVSGQRWRWRDLLDDAKSRGILGLLAASQRPVAMVITDAAMGYEVAAAAAVTNADILLLGKERLSAEVQGLLVASGYDIVNATTMEVIPRASKMDRPTVPGRVSLLTSGTTGLPKIVSHTWKTLFTGSYAKAPAARRWLVPYQIGTYAWFQIATLGLFQPDQVLVAVQANDVQSACAEAAQHGVTAISATPTFWRMCMFSVPRTLLTQIPLQQISLGGEAVDQSILDQLRDVFPGAEIVHVYASSEVGACIVVRDKLAGFPAALLDRRDPRWPQLKIVEGRLQVRSPFSSASATGDENRWIDTGDLVEQRGDRVLFLGRADRSMINVGGNKAYPADIESVLLSHPAIVWCRVRATRAPMVGYLPEADYCLANDAPEPSEIELAEYCRNRLAEYAVPRLWNRLDRIPIQGSLKSEL